MQEILHLPQMNSMRNTASKIFYKSNTLDFNFPKNSRTTSVYELT